MGNRKRHMQPITDEEEAEIQRQIAEDPDDFDATEEDIARAKPFAEAFPDLMESIRRTRGRPPVDDPKLPVTIRLDREVVEKFKATGKGWQGRMNEVLKAAKI
jgi:uncharacterized protein (DUF4415 family)